MSDDIEELMQYSSTDETREDLVKRLRRIRTVICPNKKYEDEVERCPCVRGGADAGGMGGQTGCKDILDAIERLES